MCYECNFNKKKGFSLVVPFDCENHPTAIFFAYAKKHSKIKDFWCNAHFVRLLDQKLRNCFAIQTTVFLLTKKLKELKQMKIPIMDGRREFSYFLKTNDV